MALAPPAFQFYPGDFLVSTTTMSNAQVGAYIRLLSHQWVNGGIPQDVVSIAKIMHEIVPTAGRLFAGISSKFVLDSDGLLKNPRLEEVRRKHLDYLELQAANGHKGGRPTKKASLSENLNPNETSSSSSSSSSSVRTERTRQTASPHPVENARRTKELPNVKVLAAMILKEGVLQIPRIADQAEAAKHHAARLKLAYDSRAIASALDSATAQAAKQNGHPYAR